MLDSHERKGFAIIAGYIAAATVVSATVAALLEKLRNKEKAR